MDNDVGAARPGNPRGSKQLNTPSPKGPADLQDLAKTASGPNVGFNGPPGNVLAAGAWPEVGPAFPLISPQRGPNNFPTPTTPAQPPFDEIKVPQHVSTSAWQMSFYDPTSQEPAAGFKKLGSGPVDINTGKLTGEGFHQGSHRFRQV